MNDMAKLSKHFREIPRSFQTLFKCVQTTFLKHKMISYSKYPVTSLFFLFFLLVGNRDFTQL